MNYARILLAGLVAALVCSPTMKSVGAASDYAIQPVRFTDVTFTDGFWAPRLETNRTVTIPLRLRAVRGDRPHRQLRDRRRAQDRRVLRHVRLQRLRRLQGDRGRGLLAARCTPTPSSTSTSTS